MPLVQIKLIEGVFNPEQKRKMLTRVTDAMVSVEGENMRPLTTVLIEETKSGDWALGGKPLEAQDVKSIASGEKKAA